jgi:3-deoxy-7-phosphoheptulonate synthase
MWVRNVSRRFQLSAGGILAKSSFLNVVQEKRSMIVVMQKGATQDQINHMAKRVEELGLKSHVIVGTERTVIAAIGEKREQMRESLESGPGVAEVVPILAPYKVASREVKPEPTQVVAGSLTVGAGVLGVIAGPCSVETE